MYCRILLNKPPGLLVGILPEGRWLTALLQVSDWCWAFIQACLLVSGSDKYISFMNPKWDHLDKGCIAQYIFPSLLAYIN